MNQSPTTRQAGRRELPKYAATLAAYHRAFAAELSEIVGTLLIDAGDRVLDLACGDGIYSRLLADRVGEKGLVVALDISRAWLNLAASEGQTLTIQACQASAARLPLADDAFDLTWCAQSLYSLPSMSKAVDEMRRVTRPGGIVAIFETDTLHHLLLPWPVELELEVRAAELMSFADESSRPRKFYVGRQLVSELQRAGLEHVGQKVWATTRQPPLAAADREFFLRYLDDIRARAAPHLRLETLAELDRWLTDDGRGSIADRPDFAVVCVDRLCWGVKPGCV